MSDDRCCCFCNRNESETGNGMLGKNDGRICLDCLDGFIEIRGTVCGIEVARRDLDKQMTNQRRSSFRVIDGDAALRSDPKEER